MTWRRATLAGLLALSLAATGCGGGGPDEPGRQVRSALTVSSTAFADGNAIPSRFTCKGRDVSPALEWSGVPAGAAALALVVADPDAPRGTYYHWVVLDIDRSATGVPEGAVPGRGRQAENSAGHPAYDGPCPPSGTHHYRFTVYALRSRTGLGDGAALDKALSAIDQRAVAKGVLTGTYAAD